MLNRDLTREYLAERARRGSIAAVVILLGTACTSPPSEEPAHDSSPALPTHTPSPAPWSAPRLLREEVAGVYRAEWMRAENRSTCAILAPTSLGDGAGATPRAATFSGGWAVAYDRPGMRSAFGVAGTASKATDDAYDAWPNTRRWADGSSAGYGPEGGSGPNQLAYLRVAGQECLYNVWSRLGVTHLDFLLSQLRFVE